MLRLQRAPAPRSTRQPRIGLALAGGGPLGAIYELGVLRALEDVFEGIELTMLDAYVGVSSGSIIAASLANDLSPTDLGRIFINMRNAEQPFRPERFLRPAFREYLRLAARAPGAALRTARGMAKRPLDLSLDVFSPLAELVPSGLFDNQAIEQYFAGILSVPGRSNDFRDLATKLFIVAVDLDTGTSVRFGASGQDHVPISKAIQASAALPGLYPPVEIDGKFFVDGALRRTLHASVALDQDLDILIGVNPLVPFNGARNHGPRPRSLARNGLPTVLSQTFRAIIQSRMEIGLEKYMDKYPQSHLLVIEPDRDDELMFFSNVFSYAERRELSEHAYQQTRRHLGENIDLLLETFKPYDLGIDFGHLEDPKRTFRSALDQERSPSALTRRLNRVLDRLETDLSPAA